MMNITRLETTIIPQTLEGQKFAYEYEKRVREQGALIARMEDPISITIKAEYHLTIKEQNE